MGRWEYSDRWTVDGCATISTKIFKRYFDGTVKGVIVRWGKSDKSSVSVEISTVEGDEHLRLKYVQIRNKKSKKFDYKIRLVSTPCNFGGRRWWFICPLGVSRVACKKRVGTLHLKGRYFGCRKCHNLTYRSCQESHKYDSMFRSLGIDPKLGKEMF